MVSVSFVLQMIKLEDPDHCHTFRKALQCIVNLYTHIQKLLRVITVYHAYDNFSTAKYLVAFLSLSAFIEYLDF